MALYHATGGDQWVQNDNWLQPSPSEYYPSFVEWSGVYIADGDVVGLNLSENNLTGPLPEEIGDLLGLEELSLWGNNISSLPSSLGKLSNLESLKIWGNQLNSFIENTDSLLMLEELNLSGNLLTGFPLSVTRLSNLKELTLIGAQITSIPNSIENLVNLEYLVLGDNQITELPSTIGKLTNLNFLSIYENNLTSLPPEIGNLSNLEILHLPNNNLTYLPSDVSKLTKLLQFDIRYNQLNSLPASIKALSQLERLLISFNQFTSLPAAVTELDSLEYLYAQYNEIDSLTSAIGNLKKLRYLYLSVNNIPNLPEEILDLPLSAFYIDNNDLTSLPNFSTRPNPISTFLVYRNRIIVDDIAQNLTGLDTYSFNYFDYSRQGNPNPYDSVRNDSVSVGDDIDLRTNIIFSHPHTRLQWQREQEGDWIDIPGESQSTYSIINASHEYMGQYRIEITNDWVSDMHQYVTPINLIVAGSPPEGQIPDDQELSALTALYHATNGDLWDYNQNWLQGDNNYHFSTWYGIKVRNGDVVSVDLNYNNLNGTLPPEISQLTQLESLNLKGSQLSSFPEELSELSNLRTLTLSDNGLTQIPSQVLTLSTLERLEINDNNLATLPSGLGNMINLQRLDLDDNQLSSLPSSFGSLSKLKWLDLDDNQLSILPDSFSSLSLDTLDLEDNLFTSFPKELLDVTSLIKLDLGENQLISISEDVSKLINLKWLDLDENQLDTIPTSIFNLPALVYLDLDDNKLTHLPDLTGLPNISQFELDINNNLIDNNSIAHNLSGLDTHSFDNFYYRRQAEITGESQTTYAAAGANAILQAFSNHHSQSRYQWQRQQSGNWIPIGQETQDSIFVIPVVTIADSGQYRCRIINNWVTDWEGVPFEQYSEPITLVVEGSLDAQTQALHDFVNSMNNSGALPSSWNLANPIDTWQGVVLENGLVTEVVLREAAVQGSIPPTFADLTQLKNLDLTASALQGPLPALLNGLSELETLALGGNALNGSFPTLSQLTELQTLNLSGSGLTGSLPSWLSSLDQLQELKLGANQLSGSIPGETLSQLEELRVLDLHSNQFTDTIPPLLANTGPLPINLRLQEVDLSNNQLTGSVPVFFHQAWALKKLHLQGNNLTYLPDLSKHRNADSLHLQVEANRIPLADIANNHTGPNAYPYLTFTYAPQSVVDTVFVTGEVATLGRDVALRVDLKEHPQHQYEWEEKTANGDWTPITGANERSYVIRNATPADTQKDYRVKLTNAYATSINARTDARELVAKDFQHYVRSYTPRKEFTIASNVDTTNTVDDVSMTTSYVDGFGRTVQTVVRGGGGTADQDLVQFTSYDALGRADTAFLPYSTTVATGAYRPDSRQQQAAFYQAANDPIVDSNYPFSQVRYENSPLSRVLEQGGPGADWQLGGHTATQDYRANTEADAVAKLTVDSFDSIRYLNFPVGGNYPVGKLHVAETTDENGHYVQEFSNLEGQLVLKRVQGPNGNLNTYSVYDNSGRLRFVIPPQAVAEMDANWNKANNLTFRERWMFIYYYDSYGRASAEHIPGGGINKMIYDRWGRLVYSQNAAMRAQNANQWSFTKYDYLDRPIMTGVFVATQNEAGLRQQVATTTDRFETTSATGIGYTLNQSWPQVTEASLRTVSYYDKYSFPHATQSDMIFTSDIGGQTSLTNMKGELTGSLTRNLSDQTWLRSVIYYDAQYRPIVAITDNHLGGTDRTTTRYESKVRDEVVETITKHVTASDDHTIRQTYDYDHQSRPTEVTHKVDTESTVTLASYTYNGLGQLVQKQLNDNAPTTQATQTVDYRYHIRGWLSSINDLNDADAYYAQLLNYQTQGQYNGNIAQVQWKNQGEEAKSYNYSYDAADRLTGASFQQQVSGSWSAGNFSVSGITYDGNGNLLTLQRQGEVNNAATTLDHLQYAYQGNRLASVQEQTGGNLQHGFVDNPTPGSDEYGYDAAGNLVRDDNKEITNITYDPVLNLPLEVSMSNGTLRYTYDAAGIRLSQTLLDSLGNEVKTTRYDGPFEYDGNRLSLIHHDEGRVYYNQDSSHQAYHFDLKDHLGNVRVTFSSVPVVLKQMLTMETTAAPEEEILFEGVSAHRQTLAFHNTTEASQLAPSPNKVATLLPGQQGIGKSLRVQAGDKVTLQVGARYETRPTSVQGLEGVVTELARAAQGTATGLEAVGAVESLNGAATAGALARGKEAQPEAYLNYLVFDENHQLISQGFQPVSEAAAVGPDQPDAAPETLWAEVPIQEAGYLYTYLSNEQGSGMPVFFDDFSVVHQTHIVQVNDYYPFGARHDQTSFVADHAKYGYQGKELTADLNLNLLDFHARQYDPILGRFHSSDPMAMAVAGMSPYAGMAGNPVSYVDPDGRLPILVPILIGVAAGGFGGYQAGRAQGATGWDLFAYTALGAGIGAASGGIGAGVSAGVGASVSGAYGGLIGAVSGGAAAGAFNGAAMAGLAGGNAIEGFWKGGVSGLVGAGVGSYISGGVGALAGGFAGGGTSAALYGGDAGDILTSGLIGGAIAYGSYQAQMEIGYRSSDMKVNGEPLTRKQYRGMSLAAQRSFARGKEWGGWLTDDGGIVMDPSLGERAQTNRGPMPDNAVARFHTHPNLGNGYVESHSVRDIGLTKFMFNMDSYVVGRQNTYRFSPVLYDANIDPVLTSNPFLRYPFYIHPFKR